MKVRKIASLASAIALAATLVACGSGKLNTSMTNEGAVQIEAEKANAATTVTAGTISVADDECIVICPALKEGFIRVTIETGDGKTKVYDKDVSGSDFFSVDAAPDTYEVVTSAEDATGCVVVFTSKKNDLATTNDALAQALAEVGVSQETISTITSK